MIFLRKNLGSNCIFCSSGAGLSGEHLVKKSLLKRYHPGSAWVVPRPESGQRPRLAQSPRSKAYHFDARVCQKCNSERFQAADRNFDAIHLALVRLAVDGLKFSDFPNVMSQHFSLQQQELLFQYFARLMTLHVAQSKGPVMKLLAQHALGGTDLNRIMLTATLDKRCKLVDREFLCSSEAVSHGGLVVNSKDGTDPPVSFHSYIYLAPIRYTFWVRVHWIERLEMRLFHRVFLKACRQWQSEAWRSGEANIDGGEYGL